MHNYITSPEILAKVQRRLGRRFANESIDPARAALIVIDMQNYYVAEGFPSGLAQARAVVPAINRMAAAMRAAGGKVIWVLTSAQRALQFWPNHHKYGLSPESTARRLKNLAEDSEGYRIFPQMDARAGDLRVFKTMYSAMLPGGASNLTDALHAHGIDTLLVAGTKTNVCCESTARDAYMLDYRVVMLSDANATSSDAEHAATLDTFQVYFGDVMTVDEAAARLRPSP